MQPKFNANLDMTRGGKWVKAAGPVPLNGTEREAYIAVFITQGDGVTGMGIGEMKKPAIKAATDAAMKRLTQTQSSNPALPEILELVPQWDLLVHAREGKFAAGPAEAVAWLLVRGESEDDESEDDEYYATWTDEVSLVESRALARALAEDEAHLRQARVRVDDIDDLRAETDPPVSG